MDKHCHYAPVKLLKTQHMLGPTYSATSQATQQPHMGKWCSVYRISCLEPEQKPTLYRSSEIAGIFLYFNTISIQNSFLSRKTQFSFWRNITSMRNKWSIRAGGYWRPVSCWSDTGWWIPTNVSEDNAASIFKIECCTYQERAPFWNVMW